MAAGKGTRMKSRLPKVLQRLAGRPLLGHVLSTAAQLDARSAVVVTGHGADQVEPAMAAAYQGGSMALKFVRQEPQLGTGHAVQQAVPALAGDGMVIVLSGDVPLTQADTLRALVDAADGQRLALLTVRLPDPTGYGRIVRGEDGTVRRIVEHKDASEAERAIDEIYSGIMAVPARHLAGWLARLTNDNAQGEYYLTDVVAMAVADGVPVVAHCIADPVQVAGVNSPLQLAELERAHQGAQARALMEQGVRLADPARFDLRDDPRTGRAARLACGQDVEIDVGCIFSGHVEIGEGARIGAYCSIANATIAAGAPSFIRTRMLMARRPASAWARAPWSARLRACAPVRNWAAKCTSATSSRSRTPCWPMAPRPTTWPTWAMPRWASASTTARAPSRPTTTA